MTEVWLFLAIKGIAWLRKLKIPSRAGFSPSLNFAFISDGFFLLRFFHQGYKGVLRTLPLFIPLLSSLQRRTLLLENVLAKICLGSNAGL